MAYDVIQPEATTAVAGTPWKKGGGYDIVTPESQLSPSPSAPTGVAAIPQDVSDESQRFADVWAGNQNPASKVWQSLGLAGETAGKIAQRALQTTTPIVMAPLKAYAKYELGPNISQELKSAANPVVDFVKQKADQISKTPLGTMLTGDPNPPNTALSNMSLQDIADTWPAFKQENPELAANLEAGGNIVKGMTLGTIGGKSGAGEAIERALGIGGRVAKDVRAATISKELPKVLSEADLDKNAIPSIEESEPEPNLSKPQVLTKPKDIKRAAPEAPKAGLFSELTPSERMILSLPEEGATPYPEHLLQAKKAVNMVDKTGAAIPTPMDMEARKAYQSLQKINGLKNAAGSEMGNILKDATESSVNTNQFINTAPIKQQFNDMLRERLSARIDESGKMISDQWGLKKTAGDPAITGINNAINELPDEALPQQVNDLMARIRNEVDNQKATMAIPQNTPAEGLGKSLLPTIRQLLGDHVTQVMGKDVGDRFMNLRQNYANLTEVSNEFSRRIGNVLGEDGQPRMGASLLKSAVQSNSDRNSKALFSLVKQITGNDHYRGALNAQIAMQAVGDPRINDLLKSVGAIKDIMSLNKEGILTKGAEGVLNAVRGNKLKQTLDYYNKYHTPNIGLTAGISGAALGTGLTLEEIVRQLQNKGK
jgi:hypothetical protein